MTDYSLLSFKEGLEMRRIRAAEAHAKYKSRHTAEEQSAFLRFNFMHLSISELHPQDARPHVYRLFTIASQWVFGDSLEELLDNAIDASLERARKHGAIP